MKRIDDLDRSATMPNGSAIGAQIELRDRAR